MTDTERMSAFTAIQIAEGSSDADEETVLQAWQYLIDTGLAWSLQGSYGRTAARLIEDGLCVDPREVEAV
jgi:hypothetical protein